MMTTVIIFRRMMSSKSQNEYPYLWVVLLSVAGEKCGYSVWAKSSERLLDWMFPTHSIMARKVKDALSPLQVNTPMGPRNVW